MIEQAREIIGRYQDLQAQLSDPDILSDQAKSIPLSRELARLRDMYPLAQSYAAAHDALEEAKSLLSSETDPDMLELAKAQKADSETTLQDLTEKLTVELLPKDPMDDRNIFLEIRPAAGGDEAGLFAAELLKSYMMYAQSKGRKPEIVEHIPSDTGGIKFAMVKISGERVYSFLKHESGVHRVQRIPATESQGRVHTSTITVAIMPEVDAVDFVINPNDVEMDTLAASSSGGQNANKNQTGVRLRHIPTGVIVMIADSKSQLQNKEKAREVLRSRLYQEQVDKQQAETRELRGSQIGGGDRSEKIRTYNFPQDRVTDHRIHESRSNLPAIMSGQLEDIISTLVLENQRALLAKGG